MRTPRLCSSLVQSASRAFTGQFEKASYALGSASSPHMIEKHLDFLCAEGATGQAGSR